jgi:hypothetical protein
VALAVITSLPLTLTGWVLSFLTWFFLWAPLVALLEYTTHRWIMHKVNRLLDSKLSQFKAHGTHHQGVNDQEFVDMSLKNCLLLTSPFFLLLVSWGLAVGPLSSIVIPAAALLSWSFVYAYLWTQIHRAIHGTDANWFRKSGPIYRFFRNHHLKHHGNTKANYGTVFPWTDYLFFTWHERQVAQAARAKRRRVSAPSIGSESPRPFHP